MTLRAIRILKEVDLIAAEDTRNSIKLLNHFEIKTPMTSYHEFNKIDKGRYLIEQLQSGVNIALITDAGTPGISDPGEELVAMAQEVGIEVTSLPGACALITALTISGRKTRRFSFEAFLPQDKKERALILNELVNETRTIILYEAPHRLVKTLAALQEVLGNRKITICRELTKRYETAFLTTIEEAIAHYTVTEPRGECVILVEGRTHEELLLEEQDKWLLKSVPEHMEYYLNKGIAKKEAMKLVANDRGTSKREIYAQLLEDEE
jgi:16S rRNA (cytidine1402-2'-O)-methyltransferase